MSSGGKISLIGRKVGKSDQYAHWFLAIIILHHSILYITKIFWMALIIGIINILVSFIIISWNLWIHGKIYYHFFFLKALFLVSSFLSTVCPALLLSLYWGFGMCFACLLLWIIIILILYPQLFWGKIHTT